MNPMPAIQSKLNISFYWECRYHSIVINIGVWHGADPMSVSDPKSMVVIIIDYNGLICAGICAKSFAP